MFRLVRGVTLLLDSRSSHVALVDSRCAAGSSGYFECLGRFRKVWSHVTYGSAALSWQAWPFSRLRASGKCPKSPRASFLRMLEALKFARYIAWRGPWFTRNYASASVANL